MTGQEFIRTNETGKFPVGVSEAQVDWQASTTQMIDTALDRAHDSAQGAFTGAAMSTAFLAGTSLKNIASEVGSITKTKSGLTIVTFKNGRSMELTAEQAREVEEATTKGLKNSPGNACMVTSVNQINSEIERGQAPKSVSAVDTPRSPQEKAHVYLDGRHSHALNKDGTWKHKGRVLTADEEKWLKEHGWNLPAE